MDNIAFYLVVLIISCISISNLLVFSRIRALEQDVKELRKKLNIL